MTKPSPVNFALDDKDLDDAALWAAIDSAAAAAASLSTDSTTPNSHKLHHKPLHSPVPYPSPLLSLIKNPKSRHHMPDGEVLQEHSDNNHSHHPPSKIARSCVSEFSETSPPPPLAIVNHVQCTRTTPSYCSPESRRLLDCSPQLSYGQSEERQSTMTHSLAGRFPSVSLFKEYQNAAMAIYILASVLHIIAIIFARCTTEIIADPTHKDSCILPYTTILEKSDYTMISGHPFIKKTGWRKISFYFNLSYEIKDKTIEFDDNRNVQRAEFVVRAYMQGGRFSDGWGSCERREKRFLKPNHDIPSTAETRAKNKACQDLLGIGEYRPGVHAQR